MPQPTEPRPVLTWEEDVGAAAVHDEVRALDYRGSYPSFPRALRARGLRPHCEACAGVTGRETVEIAHPPGEETQWDWVELPGAPWGGSAHVLVGALSYSSQARAVLAETEDLPHLVEALDGVARRFGGTTRRWRVDRMATAIPPCQPLVRRLPCWNRCVEGERGPADR